MPVCLNCGKDIPDGQKYCDDCASTLKNLALDYLQASAGTGVRAGRSRQRVWFIVIGVLITALFTGIAYGMMSLFPADEISEMQAERCRAKMSQVEKAVDKYTESEGLLPSEGRVTTKHVLVTEGFLSVLLRCPTTDRYYVIKYEDGKPVVTCDSNLKGHELE